MLLAILLSAHHAGAFFDKPVVFQHEDVKDVQKATPAAKDVDASSFSQQLSSDFYVPACASGVLVSSC